jgi:uncharacterized protein HemY
MSGDASQEAIPFDPAQGHRVFSVETFNAAWDLIEKDDRTDEDVEEMISLAHASAWHWSRRGDVRPKNRTISAWQLSRVYAEAGRYDESERYARRSLEIAEAGGVGPVFTGYAYEALARIAAARDDTEQRDEWVARARAEAEKIDDEQDRDRLLKDLEDLA